MEMSLPSIDTFPKIITCTIEGILEPDDLLMFTDEAKAAIPAEQRAQAAPEGVDLKRVREKHHMVARLTARGMTQRLVATITGYTESYITVLLDSPAMEELVTFYRLQSGNAAEVIAEKLRNVGTKALEAIEDKLDAGEGSLTELTQIAKLGLDRAGHGPTQKVDVRTESHLYDHAQLEALNRAALEGSKEYIIKPAKRVALPSPDDAASDDLA